MATLKQATAKSGRPMHLSVGALVRQDGKYLLIDRAVPPFGFAGVAGHVDEGESPEQALVREVEEEIGLQVTDMKLLFEEELDWNWCSKGVNAHHWYLFECDVAGDMKRSKRETRSAGWYNEKEIRKLALEPVWRYWFKKINVI